MSPALPPRWSDEEFETERLRAIHIFRELRIQEPLEQYLEAFEVSRDAIDTLLESTVDLSELLDRAVDVLSDEDLQQAARYLAGPPISADDLKIIAIDASLTPSQLRKKPEMAKRVIEVILLGVDRRRFPWLAEDREPTESERNAAVVATSALLAQRKVMTGRANDAKKEQEQAIKDALSSWGFAEVARRVIHNLTDAPEKGTFCAESVVGERKADVVARLYDGRMMPIEAKVSNSSTNSVKRLNNDASVKARHWTSDFGPVNIVPSAVLGGVYKLHNLRSAQDSAGLTIFWAHDLSPMEAFIESTKP